ncbi:DUF1656 domain-containing protein [Pseudomonas aeruginosa]|uniref:DUF1656 domain-containing protein n=1 Tax=Pseudomonas aeruginosa TaxID=287 RepID=UPI002B485B47|nr:DUF1656 domain-containing protein [Pseudomonas aeruginosa]MEB3081560.1 DUF1656 domain-containing protein [Pseudomonas aeruginosa]MEB3143016.1 DUF1656 domain-containing protein [Pseudomonas aeruginosa]
MRPEIDIYGVFIPTFAVILLGCFLLFKVVHWLLSCTGFYQHVWHRALFDIALYFSLLGVFALVLESFFR